MESNDLCYLSLRDLARLLGARRLSAREVMAAHLEQIRRWNPHLNAIVAKLDDEACLALAEAADAADARFARGEMPGALLGDHDPSSIDNAKGLLWSLCMEAFSLATRSPHACRSR